MKVSCERPMNTLELMVLRELLNRSILRRFVSEVSDGSESSSRFVAASDLKRHVAQN